MKRPLRKLPLAKQRELDAAVEIIQDGFTKAISTRRADRLKNGRILRIVLFGSYARGDWVHDPVGRYFSDFDLLVVVDHEDLTDFEFWEDVEKRLLAELSAGAMRTPVSLIVHSLDDVNWKLEHGRGFFIDIARDGVILKDTPGVAFSEPQPLPPATALEEALDHFEEWQAATARFLKLAQISAQEGLRDEEWRKNAAFNLHQATETIYQGLLQVLTLYSPKSHNLIRLRNMTEPLEPSLRDVWPHETKFQKRCFELLRAAYVKARYSRRYRITEEELAYLTERIEVLREVVNVASERRLNALRAAAEQGA
ncbi:HEPN domain-containing protein [Brevundimonas sp. BAL450]|uniref:HEPN domain-containing protein n=1 Tax=Brevundimonas sp. BAL450 TaxID=1708162 RepID=UPI0018CAD65A|nr:HEPN domain-containing protein [Brevundimonas sp. BAL450]MBG7614647.1 HEPN domain-containing protein [Brevundimonas sp. BAL450]